MPESAETRVLKGAAPPTRKGVEREVGLTGVLRAVLERDTTVRVARYVIQGRVGAGGMGAVYRAWDPRLERTVALKLLNDRQMPDDMLEHEARALAKLTHPNVVSVYDVGREAQGSYVAMELVDGPTLHTWLETHQEADAAAIVKLFVQAGRGLAAAHAVDVVHRDFKPANAIVGSDGRVRVVDFGIARVGDEADRTSRAGTPGFMAPEQRDGAGVDARSDQYAFCVSLLRALDPPDAPPRSAELSRDARAALERGRSEDPSARWPEMTPLLDALQPPPRSRALWLGVSLGVVGTAVAAVAMVGDRTPACPVAEFDITTAWSGERRDALVERFVQTPRAATFVTRVDEFVEHWIEAREEACELRVASDPTVARAGDERLACLDLVARGLDGFVVDLAERDEAQLLRATLALETIVRPKDCASSERGVLVDVSHDDLVLDVQAGTIARRLFAHDEAVAKLVPAYERAVERGVPRLASLAAYELSVYDNDERESQWMWGQRALARAEEAHDIDLMVRAWIHIAELEQTQQPRGPWEEALGHAIHLGQSGTLRPYSAAALAQSRGFGAKLQGDHAAALEHFAAAIPKFEQSGTLGAAAAVHCSIAQMHAAMGELDAAQQEVDTCLERLSQHMGPEHPSLMLRLGLAMSMSTVAGDYRRTVSLADRAITIGKQGTHRAKVRIAPFIYASGALTELGETARALEYLYEGVRVADALDDADARASVHAQLGGTLSESGDCKTALAHFDTALEHAKDKLTVGIGLLNRAECKAKLGLADDAMEDVDDAWETLATELPQTSTLRLQLTRFDGQISLYAGRLDRALEKLDDVEAKAESRDFSAVDTGYTFYLRARVEARLDHPDEANAYLAKAQRAFAGHEDSPRYDELREWISEGLR